MSTVPGPTARLIRLQARWHTATCTITRPGAGDPVWNDETGTYDDPPPTTVYSGACLVTPTGGDRVQEFGEGPVVTRQYTISIEDLTADVHVEDTITITDSRDPLAEGRTMRVLDIPKSELVTVRRLIAEEVLT